MSLFNRKRMFAYVAQKQKEKKPIWLPYLENECYETTQNQYSQIIIQHRLNLRHDSFQITFALPEIIANHQFFTNGDNMVMYTAPINNGDTPLLLRLTNAEEKNYWTQPLSALGTTIHTIVYDRGTIISDGVESPSSHPPEYVSDTSSNHPMQLFSKAYRARIYSLSIYRDSKLIINLRPCLNPNTFRPAMYDTVNKKYYYNEGTGEFQYDLSFVELDYIESDGHEYIDTGVSGNAADIDYNIQVLLSEKQIYGYPIVFGSRSNGGRLNRFYVAIDDKANTFYIGDGADEHYLRFETSQAEKQMTISKTGNEVDIDNSKVYLTSDFQVYPIYLLSANFNGQPDQTPTRCIVGKMFSATFSNNNLVVRDMIPCRMNDGSIGMWDFITGKFYGNSGTGKFKGYIGDKQVGKSIQGDGKAYIDIGVTPTEDTSARLLWYSNTVLTGGNLFGSFGTVNQDRFQMVFSGNKLYIGYGPDNTVLASSKYCNGDTNDFFIDAINKKFIGNGTVLNNSLNAGDLVNRNGLSLYLFNTHQPSATHPIQANIQYCFLMENNVIIYILIPINSPNGEVGMLDIVSGKMFTNNGTGEFTFVE